ncbi:ribosome maturation factor RimP [Sinomonas sp. ASV322]|uniref:ribosome maturation factor RimP n=1 Tax=Sinomonas sp. ASV322 TaxID=3041920 RepID=UPI0027DB1266|nr:ribosome maturation factor RimP [Sinomonas sp. ASV322]MDQ4502719.1 ribosome maturation factor RimP [Sinomonas sp. ASV322]
MSEPRSEPAEQDVRPSREATGSPFAAEEARLHALLEPTVQAHRLFLEGISVKVAGAHRTVHVVVDLPQEETGGVGLDVIAEISRELSDVLDGTAGTFADNRPYDLEVSSPGIARPLTEPRHWHRARGRLVKVNVIQGENVTGRLTHVTDDGVTLVPDLPAPKGVKPKQGEPVALPFSRIRSGRVEVEFARVDEIPEDAFAAFGADTESDTESDMHTDTDAEEA